MKPAEYELAAHKFSEELALTPEKARELEENTRDQSHNAEWKEARMKRITSSRFGQICKMRLTTSTANCVKYIVQNTFEGTEATAWGIEKEPEARKRLEAEIQKPVQLSGLVVHPEYGFLGASPDGVIADLILAEIKCPFKLKGLTHDEAKKSIGEAFIQCLDRSGKLKRNHNYYYQIQGQLETTGLDMAIFVIYSENYFTTEIIKRDKSFWRQKMLPRLSSFFAHSLLPELVDSRLERGQPLRHINVEGKWQFPFQRS